MRHLIASRISFKDDLLFEKYLVMIREVFIPSLKSQTCKNFDVCIIVNERHKEILENEFSNHGWKLLIVVGTIRTYNEKILSENYEIQTRHDCDDWMDPSYVEKIQEAYEKNKNRFEEFLISAQPTKLDYATKNEYHMAPYSSKRTSMFLSLCQRLPCKKSIYQEMHGDYPKIVPNVILLGGNLVKWNIHGSNASKDCINSHDVPINFPKLTIVTSVFGNLDVVKDCLHTWFPLMPNWEMVVYDQKVSELDGTDKYITELQKKHNFRLVRDGKIRSHPDAINFLLNNHVHTDWVLHLDSDLKLTDREFFKWLNRAMSDDKMNVYGMVESYGKSRFKKYEETPNTLTLHLPRVASYIVLFRKNFMDKKQIDFSNTIIENGNLARGTGFIFDTNEPVKNDIKIRVTGDTAWKLYWESVAEGSFGLFPSNIWKYCSHKMGSSREWMSKNMSAIRKMKENEKNDI